MISLAEVKTFLGITDTSKDALITTWMPIVEGKVKALLNREFDGDDVFPDHFKPNLARLVDFEIRSMTAPTGAGGAVASRRLGSFSVSYRESDLDRISGYPNTIIAEMIVELKIHRVHNGGKLI